MKYFSAGELWRICFMLMIFSLVCAIAEEAVTPKGALLRGRNELDLLMVLNTSDPLYLYYFCTDRGKTECYADGCFNETYTCENWRKNDLTNATYNFTRSLRNQSKWDSMNYSAQILSLPWPPTEMKFNTTTPMFGNLGLIDMNLTYNQPDSYNCSVFSVTYPRNGAENVTTTAMYIRGNLTNGSLPTDECQMHFLTTCHNRTIYKPYNLSCIVPEETQQVPK
uniref:Putative secreted peptide n=1 Tax=Rhipicephalus pulchellus TaxID=72859 RepID=L7M9B5_RHIPC